MTIFIADFNSTSDGNSVPQRMIDKYLARDGDEQNVSFGDDVCYVCLSRVATVHAYPCGHKISCRLCAIMMLKRATSAADLSKGEDVHRDGDAQLTLWRPINHDMTGHRK
ncbi:hypothetical protein KIN20_001124 [Parelaphostrongylus tenuis]|uniref:Uncharacterized protein n=1 Tax=Parelaphostrongylus tenuis TaxID=148309 RepID=A0AAD5QG20_PARTN|nr:hypothetical protein KIN20_001124 [Parelaphostrongylus tenuis]